jgi:hypothetical protein
MGKIIKLTESDLTKLVKRVIKEELSNKQQSIKDLVKSSGITAAIKIVGGPENYIKLMYDGDFDKFVKDNNIQIVKISDDGMSMYLDPIFVNLLMLNDSIFGAKKLGKFRYGPKDGLNYSFDAELLPQKSNGEIIRYKVVGTSGDSGFGYSFITKRNTLGKRNRQQIFKQIIEKYNLEKFLN